ncbi:serine/threonine protein kinase [Ectobacillus sp. sgz5001026]|uniref:serine/threonine protein kinase n=1 Tax=Ectobacillus sp. sgz5001026 TaxID=3242473 RepID=UPI0036D26997
MNEREDYTELIERLLRDVVIVSEDPYEPIQVKRLPHHWTCIGAGNYAAVFQHESYPDWVVKVYGRDYEGIEKEVKVYERLGEHPAYSQLILYGKTYLVLKRLGGITLYDAFHKGIYIPERVILDVNEALDYARARGLNPFDVHGKNVMMKDGHGYVIDVSDFYKQGIDTKWKDLVKAYYAIYIPIFSKFRIRIPYFVLDFVRHSYRTYKKWKKKMKGKSENRSTYM